MPAYQPTDSNGNPLPGDGGDQNPWGQIEGADISYFDRLANEAAQVKTKGLGRDLIGKRNAALSGADVYQRAKIGKKYYKQYDQPGGDAAFGKFGGTGNEFIDLISRGDNQFLQGLADDTGSGGGNTGSGGGSTSTGGTGAFDPAAYQKQMQDMINTMLMNQQTQLNSSLGNLQGANTTLSAGSVGNAQGTAAARARARNSSGIVNTLASRRGRRAAPTQRRYF